MVFFTESDEDMRLWSAEFAVLIVEIPRNIGHHAAPVAFEIEQSLESGCTLVMQQIVIPVTSRHGEREQRERALVSRLSRRSRGNAKGAYQPGDAGEQNDQQQNNDG